MFNINADVAVFIPYNRGKIVCSKCNRDFDSLYKGNRCPYCKTIILQNVKKPSTENDVEKFYE